jgi:3-deoxy-manno-octulosonate cytidylyltransferase (CMP-KDO synthetase)
VKTAIVIPARYSSSRLPGKPLLKQTGKYLVQHVYERACESRRASQVLIATDDSRIVAAAEHFGGRVVLTRRDHPSGTDRVAEVARALDADVIVNLQGDEPLVDPAALDLLPALLERDAQAQMATLAAPISSLEQWQDPNCVKVVCDAAGRALYFSRAPIPFVRDGRPDLATEPPRFLQHLGLYAYRRDFLLRLAELPPEPLEQLEKLEQLRVLAQGCKIRVGVVRHAAVGVDTRADYERFVEMYRASRKRKPREVHAA